MKAECAVYIHRNLTNGKVYVGMTTQSVRRRWRSGKGYRSMRFGRAIDKYGWDGFEHVIVRDKLSIEEARQLGKDIIKELDATNPKKGYNEAVGGQWGGFYKKHHSDEAKEKIRQARLRDGFSESHKKHISESKQGAKHHNAKPVYQYTVDGVLVKKWEYTSLATKQLGINKSNIGEVCSGRRKTAGGYIWSREKR